MIIANGCNGKWWHATFTGIDGAQQIGPTGSFMQIDGVQCDAMHTLTTKSNMNTIRAGLHSPWSVAISDTQRSQESTYHSKSVPRDHSCKSTDRSTMQEKTEKPVRECVNDWHDRSSLSGPAMQCIRWQRKNNMNTIRAGLHSPWSFMDVLPAPCDGIVFAIRHDPDALQSLFFFEKPTTRMCKIRFPFLCIIPVDVARPANPVSLTPPTSLSPVGWSYRYLFPEPTLLTDHTANGSCIQKKMQMRALTVQSMPAEIWLFAKIKKSMINAWEIDQSSMNPFETTAWRLKVNNKSSVMLLA